MIASDTTETQSPATRLTTMQDVVYKVEDTFGNNALTLYKHIKGGTSDQYYIEMITEVIYDLSLIPVERMIQGLEVLDDPDSVAAGFRRIATIFAAFFNKDHKLVESDLLSHMNTFPIDEVREARQHRHAGTLH